MSLKLSSYICQANFTVELAMFLKISLLAFTILFISPIPNSEDDYDNFMSYGFQRFNECNYNKAYWDFYAASLVDNITDDQKLRALYHRNVSDSCRQFLNLAENYYETGNFNQARRYYQKIIFFNENDDLSKQKALVCEDKINNSQSSNNSSMKFVNSGTFTMGNSSGRYCENFEHKVFISGLFVDLYEVTNQEYANFLNEKKISLSEVNEYIDLDDQHCQIYYRNNFYFVNAGKNRYPVVEVSWYGANAYAHYYGKRLPTEAEWEYIASFATSDQQIVDGVYGVVGSTQPNKLGIYDLYGNVREWCSDFYWQNFYATSPTNNPKTISDSDKKVVRGSSFDVVKWYYSRDCELPSETSGNLGFRCVKDAN